MILSLHSDDSFSLNFDHDRSDRYYTAHPLKGDFNSMLREKNTNAIISLKINLCRVRLLVCAYSLPAVLFKRRYFQTNTDCNHRTDAGRCSHSFADSG